MERIIGINDARPKLTHLIDSLMEGAEPVIITVNSEPKSVLISYEEYRRLQETEKEYKKLSLKLAIEKIRAKARESGLTEEDVMNEVRAVRNSKRGKS
ncbi:MAG: type II toxin-antitoxin system prevent-host-death family antitoxin [Bacillota bacterium]